ncbi:hypothetical protein N7G274_010243 [Stereocaulon virgatum]|uniref:Uncharacterized protein n=1 Tax=Stereocaulon virgatum TaxID=373712 RepID=A0ABR3ZUM4_9LECA
MAPLEDERFLSTDEKRERVSEGDLSNHAIELRSRRVLIHLVIHLLLVIISTTISLIIIEATTAQCGNTNQVFAELSVKYKPQFHTKFNESPFAGPPSLETDVAWHDLMGNMSIRITKIELEMHPQTSVQLPGGGYLACLSVFHELQLRENAPPVELQGTLSPQHDGS